MGVKITTTGNIGNHDIIIYLILWHSSQMPIFTKLGDKRCDVTKNLGTLSLSLYCDRRDVSAKQNKRRSLCLVLRSSRFYQHLSEARHTSHKPMGHIIIIIGSYLTTKAPICMGFSALVYSKDVVRIISAQGYNIFPKV